MSPEEALAALDRNFPWLPSISVRPGWYGIIRDLAGDLEQILGRDALLLGADLRVGRRIEEAEGQSAYICTTLKEKWGSLRCYVTPVHPEAERVIQAATERSAVTCELCGKPGIRRRFGWVQCLCDDHATEFLQLAKTRGSQAIRAEQAARLKADHDGRQMFGETINGAAEFAPRPGLPAAPSGSSPTLSPRTTGRRRLDSGTAADLASSILRMREEISQREEKLLELDGQDPALSAFVDEARRMFGPRAARWWSTPRVGFEGSLVGKTPRAAALLGVSALLGHETLPGGEGEPNE